MSFINMNLDDTHEAQIAPKGSYVLMISDVQEHRKEVNGVSQVVGRKVTVDFEDYPDFQQITHWLSFPQPDDEPGKAKMKQRMLKRFLVAFSIPFSAEGFQDEDFHGCRAKLDVTLEEYQKETGGEVMISNRIALPRFE